MPLLAIQISIAMLTIRFAVEWAPLPIIDFSEAGTSEGRAALAVQVRDAMRTYGFLYIVNHGYTQAQVRSLIPLTIAHGLHIDAHLCRTRASLTFPTQFSRRYPKMRRNASLGTSRRRGPTGAISRARPG